MAKPLYFLLATHLSLLASHLANASQPPIKIGPVQESYPYPRRRVLLRNGGQKVPGFDVFRVNSSCVQVPGMSWLVAGESSLIGANWTVMKFSFLNPIFGFFE